MNEPHGLGKKRKRFSSTQRNGDGIELRSPVIQQTLSDGGGGDIDLDQVAKQCYLYGCRRLVLCSYAFACFFCFLPCVCTRCSPNVTEALEPEDRLRL